jgi:LIVCS family branched-chain amino acid:cation transporter
MLMRRHIFILTYGFALFAMFFGSGNLVFPIQIGQMVGSNWLIGFLGLFLTGIFLPFLGLFVIKLYKGNYDAFFGQAGGMARILLPLFTLSLLGSFGIVPRCITVAHGGMGYLYPELSLMVFSIIFSLITYVLCIKDKIMIHILGKWMSPLLLLSLIALIGVGIYYAPETLRSIGKQQAFTQGFLTGYQTMDLFAAFFFAALIFAQIQQAIPVTSSPREALKHVIRPSIFGAGLLAVIYLGLVFLGAHYSHIITDVPPELMLPTIAEYTMGDMATLFIGVAMLLSCLTTAVALNNIYARYICSALKLDERKFPLILVGTTLVAFVISLLDFKGIAAFLAPALEISYPSIIALTIMCIVTPQYKNLKIFVFYAIFMAMVLTLFL